VESGRPTPSRINKDHGPMKFLFSALATIVMISPISAMAQTRLPAQVNVENRRAANLVSLEVIDGGGNVIARLARPLAAGRSSVVRLGRATGCDMTVQARFDDEGEVDETLNLCREKVLRFRD
jgi:hypothetical protein